MDDLRNWVVQKIKEKKISERELSRRAGCSNTFISNVLTGKSPITFKFCLDISKGLNESLLNILKMAGFVDDIPPEFMENDELRVLINRYNSLSPPAKDEFKRFLEWLELRDGK